MATLRRRHSSIISTAGYTKTSVMMRSHMTRPSLVDRPDQYQASVSGCLRGAMKTVSSEPNFVSWQRPEETASRDREQPRDPDGGRSERAGADVQANPCQKQRHNQACSTNHYDGFESLDFALSCRSLRERTLATAAICDLQSSAPRMGPVWRG